MSRLNVSKLGKAAIAAVGVVASLIAIAQAWQPIRSHTARFFEWLYPLGVVVLLAVLLCLSIASRLFSGQGYASEDEREHDRRLVAEVRALVPRTRIETIRSWDFGASWRSAWTEPFYRLLGMDDPEHVAFNRSVRRALRRLFDATERFTEDEATYGFPARDNDWRNVGWGGSEADTLAGQDRDLWRERRNTLNGDSVAVVEAYDRLMDVARRKLLIA